MRRIILLLTVGAAMLLACAGVVLAQERATPGQGPPEGVIPGQYIVVLNNDVDRTLQVASAIEQRHEDVDVGYVYDNALEGFSAEIPDGGSRGGARQS